MNLRKGLSLEIKKGDIYQNRLKLFNMKSLFYFTEKKRGWGPGGGITGSVCNNRKETKLIFENYL